MAIYAYPSVAYMQDAGHWCRVVIFLRRLVDSIEFPEGGPDLDTHEPYMVVMETFQATRRIRLRSVLRGPLHVRRLIRSPGEGA